MKITQIFNEVSIKGTIIHLLVIVTYFTDFGYYRNVICIFVNTHATDFQSVCVTIREKTSHI
jgi:hypothetical protein